MEQAPSKQTNAPSQVPSQVPSQAPQGKSKDPPDSGYGSGGYGASPPAQTAKPHQNMPMSQSGDLGLSSREQTFEELWDSTFESFAKDYKEMSKEELQKKYPDWKWGFEAHSAPASAFRKLQEDGEI